MPTPPRLLAGLILSLALAPPAHAQALDRATVGRLKAATVYIQLLQQDYLTGERSARSGSGFFVGPHGHVVTNWHVVRPAGGKDAGHVPRRNLQIQVFVHSGQSSETVRAATILAADPEADLALLATGAAPPANLPLAPADAAYETLPVWAVGFPLGKRFAAVERGPSPTFTRGTISALRTDNRDRLRMIQTDAQLELGNSGGPLVDRAGRVIGVAQSIIKNNRHFNFTVPAADVRALMGRTRADRGWSAKGSVTFRSDPPGAAVFVDGTFVGRTTPKGLPVQVPLGLRQVAVMLPERAPWVQDITLWAGDTVSALLGNAPPLRIALGPASPLGAGGQLALPAEGDTLLTERFDDRRAIRTMDQEVGGNAALSWYVRRGELHQHDPGSMLHAIYFGKPGWRDYRFRARVRLTTETADARAGLIFRETARGFYLFRVHRQTDQAQLAYHSKAPFGWFVLGQKKLDFDVTHEPMTLAVYASGPHLTCLLDGKPVFRVRDTLAAAGRVGFYSVDGRAAFDDASVVAVKGGAAHQATPDRYPTFWFTDRFGLRSGWWRTRRADGTPDGPWRRGAAGSAWVPADASERVAILDRFELTRFTADLVCRLAKPRQHSAFGLVFGHHRQGAEEMAFRVLLDAAGKGQLVAHRGKRRQVLRTFDVPQVGAATGAVGGLFGARMTRLLLQVDGKRVLLANHHGKLLDIQLPVAIPTGKLGLVTRGGGPVILHQLQVTPPRLR